MHRILVPNNGSCGASRNGHRRKYRRWQPETPMLLWQLDLVGGVFLAGSRECKILTGIDVSLPAYRGGRCALRAGGRRCVP